MEFEANKPSEVRLLTASGQEQRKIISVYNGGGMLSTEEIHNASGSLAINRDFSYDGQGRIIAITEADHDAGDEYQSNYSPVTYSYVYNADNTITKSWVTNGISRIETFYLDAQNRIFKHEDNNGNITEAIYQENNITVLASGNTIQNYTYDAFTEVKGDYLNMWKNQFGVYMPNVVLGAGFAAAISSSDNFMLSEDGQVNQSYTYVFDNEGYVIVRNSFSPELEFQAVSQIEYQ